MKRVDRWKMEMPTEQEMLPKDKYTVFDRKVKRYRKGIHSELHSFPRVEMGLVQLRTRPDIKRAKIGDLNVHAFEQMLTDRRGSKVDESQPEVEPLVFERRTMALCILYVSLRSASAMALLWNQTHSIWDSPTLATTCSL